MKEELVSCQERHSRELEELRTQVLRHTQTECAETKRCVGERESVDLTAICVGVVGESWML